MTKSELETLAIVIEENLNKAARSGNVKQFNIFKDMAIKFGFACAMIESAWAVYPA